VRWPVADFLDVPGFWRNNGLTEQGCGRIVNVSSAISAAPGAIPGLNAYAACKAALEAHALGLAAELTGTGVTVNIVRPGPVTPRCRPGSGPATRQDRRRTARPVRGDARCGPHASPDQPAGVISDLIIGGTTGQIAGVGNPATISG
jgi:NAD(P)-dependent dehydrogenase (short-subunit alcohol dehydrogenase family)